MFGGAPALFLIFRATFLCGKAALLCCGLLYRPLFLPVLLQAGA